MRWPPTPRPWTRPLKLSSTRLLDREDETVELTSQDPYAALESIDRNNRLVLMLGSWAPDNKAAPGELARKVVDAVVNAGWENLDGDLVIADEANPAFVAASRSLAPHQEVEEEKSYAKWFVIVIAALLLLLAFQFVIVIRRDRRLSRQRDDEFEDDVPAFVEDDEQDYEVDVLGDVDDLEVHEYATEHTTEPHAPTRTRTSPTSRRARRGRRGRGRGRAGRRPRWRRARVRRRHRRHRRDPRHRCGRVRGRPGARAEPEPEPEDDEGESDEDDDWEDWEDWGDESDQIDQDRPDSVPSDESPRSRTRPSRPPTSPTDPSPSRARARARAGASDGRTAEDHAVGQAPHPAPPVGGISCGRRP